MTVKIFGKRLFKHKWDREIRAYLEGEEVEMYYPDVQEWKPVQCLNKFDCNFDIRIKPEPKPDYKKYFVYNKYHKVFYDTGDNCYPNGLVATFDGESDKLKGVEIKE